MKYALRFFQFMETKAKPAGGNFAISRSMSPRVS